MHEQPNTEAKFSQTVTDSLAPDWTAGVPARSHDLAEYERGYQEFGETQQFEVAKSQNLCPKIYVASLSDYNAGILHGDWIDADQEAEAIWDDIETMLRRSRQPSAEEWAIHDYEDFGNLHLSEWESVETISRIGRGIAQHGTTFAAWASLVGTSDVEQLERFDETYMGTWESTAAYAENLVDDIGLEDELDRVVPEGLRPYIRIDYEMLARDLTGDLHLVGDEIGIYIFQP